MRFPWLQVDADFIAAHAGDFGVRLGVSRREAMGIALDLWTWALARAPDDAPPDGVVAGTGTEPDRLLAGSVGWTGPVAQFTAALEACGLAVRCPSGYRLTGFSRYKATWEKNRRRTGTEPERNRTGTGGDPARKTQTQTQTQTQKETTDLPAASAPGGGQAALPGLPEAPPSPAKKAKEAKKPREKAAPDKPPDPRHAAVRLALVAAGWPFDGGRDASNLTEILKLADQQEATRGEKAEAEILRRAALGWSQFPDYHSARTLAGLRAKWGELAQPVTPGARPKDLSRGMVHAEDMVHTAQPGARLHI